MMPPAATATPDAAYAALAARDADLARLVAALGRPDPFAWILLDEAGAADPFAELALHVVSQQISTRAALTIFGRVREAAGGVVSAPAIAAVPAEALRRAGLSAAKAASLLDLAARVLDGRVSFARLAAEGDDARVREELEAVRGVGPWSAQMFMLHHLRRPDVFPAGDLGLRAGAQAALGLPERPSPAELERRAERWRPYRSYAAALLWAAAPPARAPAVRP